MISPGELKILYITQAIDKEFYLLSPFYKWLKLLANNVEKIYAVCLQEGKHEDLPDNIKVMSLGKERGVCRISYILNFYRYCLPLIFRRKVDVIFVHMNEVYVFMLWPLAKVFRIPIVIWRAHGSLNWRVKLLAIMADEIITSSETGFPIKTKKRKIVGQGIDTDYFSLKNNFSEPIKKVIWTGRISPIKDIETLIKAARILTFEKKINLDYEIIGAPPDKEQKNYLEKLELLVKNYGLQSRIKFAGKINHEQLAEKYQQGDVFINTSNTGSLDKTVLEAMACGLVVINSNYGFKEILKPWPTCQFLQGDYKELAKKVEQAYSLNKDQRTQLGIELRNVVIKSHDMNKLVQKLLDIIKNV